MKIAIIESNHWHVPLYLDAIERSDVEVVGICDSTGQTETQLAARFRCRAYRGQADLLAANAIDFAFVFGRHSDMPELADALIARGIPFLIEKPCGVTAAEVARLALAAERRGLYVAVPFIFRLSDLGQILLASHAEAADGVDHASFRFLAGPPQRYE
ncbi:MAG: Gfo/Idh/MocA family oxidoreductase, partial [Alsobacter sp.]